jgi:hypothetical protein
MGTSVVRPSYASAERGSRARIALDPGVDVDLDIDVDVDLNGGVDVVALR